MICLWSSFFIWRKLLFRIDFVNEISRLLWRLTERESFISSRRHHERTRTPDQSFDCSRFVTCLLCEVQCCLRVSLPLPLEGSSWSRFDTVNWLGLWTLPFILWHTAPHPEAYILKLSVALLLFCSLSVDDAYVHNDSCLDGLRRYATVCECAGLCIFANRVLRIMCVQIRSHVHQPRTFLAFQSGGGLYINSGIVTLSSCTVSNSTAVSDFPFLLAVDEKNLFTFFIFCRWKRLLRTDFVNEIWWLLWRLPKSSLLLVSSEQDVRNSLFVLRLS